MFFMFAQLKRRYHLHRHLISHSNVRDCPICGKKSLQGGNYEKHLRGHRNHLHMTCKDESGEISETNLRKPKSQKKLVHDNSSDGVREGSDISTYINKESSVYDKGIENAMIGSVKIDALEGNLDEGSSQGGYEIQESESSSEDHMVDHQERANSEEKVFHCSICDLNFFKRQSFFKHKEIHSKLFEVTCVVCKKIFRNITDLENHKETHKGQMPERERAEQMVTKEVIPGLVPNRETQKEHSQHENNISETAVAQSDTFTKHIDREKKQKDLPASERYSPLNAKGIPSVIQRIKKSLQCDKCHKYFRTWKTLVTHKKKHGKWCMNKCSVCGKKFKRKSALDNHVQVHLENTSQGSGKSFVSSHDVTAASKSFENPVFEDISTCNILEGSIEGSSVTKAMKISTDFETSAMGIENELEGEGPEALKISSAEHGVKEIDGEEQETEKNILNNLRKLENLQVTGKKEKTNLGKDTEGEKGNTDNVSSLNDTVASQDFFCADQEAYVCPICGEAFNRYHKLVSHQKIHLEPVIYDCDKCARSFQTKGEYDEHRRTHFARSFVGLYECPICEKKIAHIANYNRHFRSHDLDWIDRNGEASDAPGETEPLTHFIDDTGNQNSVVAANIEKCSAKTSEADIERKVKEQEGSIVGNITAGNLPSKPTETNQSLHKKEAFKCLPCNKTFLDHDDFEQHKKSHTISCKYCGQVFNRKSNCREHMMRHSLSKDYLCFVCGKRFLRKKEYIIHMQVHKTKTMNAQDGNASSHSGGEVAESNVNITDIILTMLNDESIHSKELENNTDNQIKNSEDQNGFQETSDFGVTKENATFNSDTQMMIGTTGIETESSGTRKELLKGDAVTICKEDLVKNINLKDYKLQESEKDCVQDAEMFENWKELFSQHFGKKDYFCTICDQKFPNSQSLSEHKTTHTELPVRDWCVKCNKSFSTRKCYLEHMRLHNPNSLYIICHVCGEEIPDKPSYAKHFKQHKEVNQAKKHKEINQAKKHKEKNPAMNHKEMNTALLKKIFSDFMLARSAKEIGVNEGTEVASNVDVAHDILYLNNELNVKRNSTHDDIVKDQTHETLASSTIGNVEKCSVGSSRDAIEKANNLLKNDAATVMTPQAMSSHIARRHSLEETISLDLDLKEFLSSEFGENLSDHRSTPLGSSVLKHWCIRCKKSFNNRNLYIQHMRIHISASLTSFFFCHLCEVQFSDKNTYFKHCMEHEINHGLCDKDFSSMPGNDTKKINSRKRMAVTSDLGHGYGVHNLETELNAKRNVTNDASVKDEMHEACASSSSVDAEKSYVGVNKDVDEEAKDLLQNDSVTCTTLEAPSSQSGKPVCHICGRKFKFHWYLKMHMEVHSKSKPFKCDTCHKCLPSERRYRRHLKSHQVGKKFNCKECGKAFTHKYVLKRHLKLHNLNEVAVEVAAETRDDVSADTVVETVGESRVESVLSLESQQKAAASVIDDTKWEPLVNYATLNAKEKRKKTVKDRSRMYPRNMTGKVSISGKTRFLCPLCGKLCGSQSNLNDHVISHSNDKPYKCPLCKTDFKRLWDRNRHIKNKHSSDLPEGSTPNQGINSVNRPYKCSICSKCFLYDSVLKMHMMFHTGESSMDYIACEEEFYECTVETNEDDGVHSIEHDVVHGLEPVVEELNRSMKEEKEYTIEDVAIDIKEEVIEDVDDEVEDIVVEDFDVFNDVILETDELHQSEHFPFVANDATSLSGDELCSDQICEVENSVVKEMYTKEKNKYEGKGLQKNIVEGGVPIESKNSKKDIVKKCKVKKNVHCSLCNITFNNTKQLFGHIHKHSGFVFYQCDVCGETLRSGADYKEHARQHIIESIDTSQKCYAVEEVGNMDAQKHKWSCDICKKPFPSRHQVFSHMQTHSGMFSRGCEACGERFESKRMIHGHLNEHLTLLFKKPPSKESPHMNIEEEHDVNFVEDGDVNIAEERDVNFVEDHDVNIAEEHDVSIVEEQDDSIVEEQDDSIVEEQDDSIVEEQDDSIV